MSEEYDVLHLEDDDASAAGFVAQTNLAGVHVDLIVDVASARERLTNRRYRLLVIDLEVLENGKRRLGAGADVIKDLLAGKLGTQNSDTPIIVHTAHLGGFETTGLSKDDRVELIRKPASVYWRTMEIVRPGGEDVVLVEVLPMSESADSAQGFIVRIPGWSNEAFEVPMASFEPDQMIDIVLAEEAVYFSGVVNLDADTPNELGLRILAEVPPAELEGLSWDG